MPLLFWTKWLMSHALYYSGILYLWKRVALRGRAVVLMYHRVLPDEAIGRSWSHPAIIVRRATFERQMRLLKEQFDVVTLAQFEAHVRENKPFANPSCLVTFDDGWLDTYREALPVLRKYGVPAVVFLPAAFIGSGRMFWQEYLKRLLFDTWRRAAEDADFKARAAQALAPHDLAGLLDAVPEYARAAVMDAVHVRKYVDEATSKRQIDTLVELLADDACSAHPDDAFMSWEMVREMSTANVAFGGHGVDHRLLTNLTQSEVEGEVQGSRDALARALPGPVTSFSYPNGNWNRSIADVVSQASYRVAFSTEPGFVGVGTDVFAVPRINIHEDVTNSDPMFFGRILRVL